MRRAQLALIALVAFLSLGGARPPLVNPLWDAWGTIFLDPLNGSDSTSNPSAGCGATAFRTISELYRGRWGCVGQEGCPSFNSPGGVAGGLFKLQLCNAQSGNTDPITFWPELKNGASWEITLASLPTPAWTGTIGSDLANWSGVSGGTFGSMTFPAQPQQGQLIVNATRGNSKAFVWRQNNSIAGTAGTAANPATGAGSNTVTVTNGSSNITFLTAQTMLLGDILLFSSQAATYYSLAAPITAGTAGTLVGNYTGTSSASPSLTTALHYITLPFTVTLTASTTVTPSSSPVGFVSVGDSLMFTNQLSTTYTVASVAAGSIGLTSSYTGTTGSGVHASDITETTQAFFSQPLNDPAAVPFTSFPTYETRNTSWIAGDSISAYNLPAINIVRVGSRVNDNPSQVSGGYINELRILDPVLPAGNTNMVDEVVIGPGVQLLNVNSDRQISWDLRTTAQSQSEQNVYAPRFAGGGSSGGYSGLNNFAASGAGGALFVIGGIPCWNNYCSWNGMQPSLMIDNNAIIEDFHFSGSIAYGWTVLDQTTNAHFGPGEHLIKGAVNSNGRIWSRTGDIGSNFWIDPGGHLTLASVGRTFALALTNANTLNLCSQATACAGSSTNTGIGAPTVCGMTITPAALDQSMLSGTALSGTVSVTKGSAETTWSVAQSLTPLTGVIFSNDPNVIYPVQESVSSTDVFFRSPMSGATAGAATAQQVTGFKDPTSAIINAVVPGCNAGISNVGGP